MEKTELQAVANYIVTLESRIGSESDMLNWWHQELPRLQTTIEDLGIAYAESHDLCEKVFLRALQNKGQQCRDLILKKTTGLHNEQFAVA